MNKPQIKSIYIATLIILIVSIIFIIYSKDSHHYYIHPVTKNTKVENKIISKPEEHKSKTPVESTFEDKNLKEVVILKVLGQTYTAPFTEGDSVYSVMQKIENNKTNNFVFTSKSYSGLGEFINSINGVSGTAGHYWVYFVNNEEASVGVSTYVLHTGDTITWKQSSS